jgi:molybdate transport system substrate-binding protein
VFAAASLTDVLRTLGKRWEEQRGRTPLELVFASSSTLAKQVENGAPADLFISADQEWMDYLVQRDLIAPGTRSEPVGNELVLIAPAKDGEARAAAPAVLERKFAFAAALGDGRLAVGDPAHVPAGHYARQALESLGWWARTEPRLARAENVRAALALVERGEAPLGIVYATDAGISSKVRVVGVFPSDTHDPIRYFFGAVRGHDSLQARAALEFLTNADARAVYKEYGFTTE